jgi:hypothetical protein
MPYENHFRFEDTTMKDRFYFPTFEQMRALETAAQRARAREIARLVRAGVRGVKSLLSRAVAVPAGKGVSHA